MKIVLLLSLFSFSINAAEVLGGVDVGNGKVIQLNLSDYFDKEELLVRYMSSQRTSINNGKFMNLEKLMNKYECEKSKFQTIEVVERYPFKNGMLLSKKFSAKVNIKLTKCKDDQRVQ